MANKLNILIVVYLIISLTIPNLIAANTNTDEINKNTLFAAYTIATIEASTDEYKACGWITKRTIELCEQQDLKAYSAYVVTPLGEHLAPVIRLDDFTYFGYEQLEQIANTKYDAKLIRYDYKPVKKTRIDVPKGAVYIPNKIIEGSPPIRVYLQYLGK